jgi:hypothetical protein
MGNILPGKEFGPATMHGSGRQAAVSFQLKPELATPPKKTLKNAKNDPFSVA